MSHLKTEIWNVSGTGKHFLILCNDRAQDHLLIHKHWIANAYTFCNSHSCMTSSKRYWLNSNLERGGKKYLKLFLYLYFYSKNLIYIGISIFLSLYVRNSTMKCLCRFDPYVLYLEYSTFSDKLFSRAQYQLSLTDQMDCKSQKRSNRYRKYYTELEWWTSQLPFEQPKIRYRHALIQMH